MTWAKRQMRSLTENLDDLAGHDIVLANRGKRRPAERTVDRMRHQGWVNAIARWLTNLWHGSSF